MNIGIFDSGIGGLTLARKYLSDPAVNVTYVADIANMPYGSKSPEHIQYICSLIVNFLQQHRVDFIVVACHTASVVAGEVLKKKYPNIRFITMQDGIAAQALEATKNGNIGIIATPATIQSNVYRETLLAHNNKIRVHEQACPTLAPSIEQYFDKPDILHKVVDKYLKNLLDAGIDTLILGSTHYALVKDIIHSYAPELTLISADQPFSAVPAVQSAVPKHNDQFFVSSDIGEFQKKLAFFMSVWNIGQNQYTVKNTPWGAVRPVTPAPVVAPAKPATQHVI